MKIKFPMISNQFKNFTRGRKIRKVVAVLCILSMLSGVGITPNMVYATPVVDWQPVGNEGFFSGMTSYTARSLAIDGNGIPYVVYLDATSNNKVAVKKYSGGSWVAVGTPGFSADYSDYISIAIDHNGIPYVAYRDGDTTLATVKKLVGSDWVDVGTAGAVSTSAAKYTSIAIDSSGTPYVVYKEFNYGATVRKFDGSIWVAVGNTQFSAAVADWTTIAIDGSGTPYVVYQDSDKAYKATVMKFDGISSWVNVGTAGFSSDIANYPSIAIDSSGIPYVVYEDVGNSLKATVKKFSGGSWINVGTTGVVSPAAANYTSIAIDGSGTPYVVYQDGGNASKAAVKKLVENNWVDVGTSGFSTGSVNYTSIAIDSTGTPYVIYIDSVYGGTVQRYKQVTPVSNFANSSKTTTTADFTWTAASGATGIIIEQSPTGSSTWTTATTEAIANGATTATVTGLSIGTTYDFRLVVTGGDNEGNSNMVTVTTDAIPVSDFAYTAVTATTADFEWTAVTNATGIIIQKSLSGVDTWSTATTGAIVTIDTTATVTGLEPGTAYDFRLTVTGGVNAGNSNSIQVTTGVTVPGAPTAVSGSSGNTQVSVSFTAPASNGGSAITGYKVYVYQGGVKQDSLTKTGTSSPIIIHYLTNSTAYTFKVVATNAQGDSAESEESAAVTPLSGNIAPLGTASTTAQTPIGIGNLNDGNEATNWFDGGLQPNPDNPTYVTIDMGGPATIDRWRVVGKKESVTIYTLKNCYLQGSNDSENYVDIDLSNVPDLSTDKSIVDETLGAPSTYRFYRLKVTANQSMITWLYEFELYGALTNVTDFTSSSKTTTTATFEWTVPSGATGISMEKSLAGANTWTAATTGDIADDATTATVIDLASGTAYDFRLVVTGGAREGNSNKVAVTTNVSVPDAPTGVSATPGNRQASVSFTAPTNNGGSAITGYKVYVYQGGVLQEARTTSGANSPITVNILTNGTAYTFRVVAINAQGESAESTASTAVTPATVPNAPTAIIAVGGNESATLSFNAPLNNGGSAITGYRVDVYAFIGPKIDSLTTTGASAPITVTGLTNGTTYMFAVIAINAVGDSEISGEPTIATPNVTVPVAPTGVGATVGNAQSTVSFTAPIVDGGSAITGYKVYVYQGGVLQSARTTSGASSPITVIGLTNGTAYTFKVVAINAQGESTESTASTAVTPATVPNVPTAISAVAGNERVTLSFNAPLNNGGSAITGYKVYVYQGGVLQSARTTSGENSSITVTNLTNGTAYTFEVVAINAQGESTESTASTAVTPVTVPTVPTAIIAVGGNELATVSFNAPLNNGGSAITGYRVDVYLLSGVKQDSFTTTGESSPITVTGLTNGTLYLFSVIAINAVGDGEMPGEPASATPNINVPGAPTAVSAAAGNAQATVIFTAPTDTGESAITGYKVYVYQGGVKQNALTTTGASSPITVNGLTNGTTYTIKVAAINVQGESIESEASASATPNAPSSSGGGNSTIQPTPVKESDVVVLVNGKEENAGTSVTSTEGGKTQTTITIDENKLQEKLNSEEEKAVITIPVNNNSDVTIGELNGQMISNMEKKQAILELKTSTATYTLPAHQININAISEQVGANVELKDIKVQIEISKPTQEEVKIVNDSAKKGSFSIVVPSVEFNITCSYGDKKIEVSNFNAYVERTIAIPDGVDPSKITTGIVVDPDGTVRHVPTKVIVIDGKYYAVINSLTNSLYSVVWHPIEFKDAQNHWAKDAINDMGSRMVISGIGNEWFNPNADITRAEFAAIIVRGLGLKPGVGTNPFDDVASNEWYAEYIMTAVDYKVITGYGNGKFGPQDKITREQAMTMIARSMKITGLKAEISSEELEKLLAVFKDKDQSAAYAKESIAACIETGVIAGRSSSLIAPKEYITRAEVAAIMQRLLKKSKLI